MDLAIDTNALVYAHISAFEEHERYRAFVETHLRDGDNRIVLSPLVCHEWLHVVTDARRLDPPLTMATALEVVRDYLSRSNVVVAPVDDVSLQGALALLEKHRLGRKRIADALLAATLRAAGVKHLLTRNVRDFRVFRFLTLHDAAS